MTRRKENITHWAELKFGLRLRRAADRARGRVHERAPKNEQDEVKKEEFRHHVYMTLSEPSYSKLAGAFSLFLGLAIIVSTTFFVIETLPALGRDAWWRGMFFYAEIFFVILFSIEISLRFWSTPQTSKEFLTDFMNIIDLLSILPFYFELAMVAFTGGAAVHLDLRFLRAFRLTRMLKMGRFSSELQLLVEGFIRARVSIAMLVCTLILGMVFFATLLWLLERGIWNPELQCHSRPGEAHFNGCSPFESVPAGFWWGITTMTTVGYGDTFPISSVGRVVGGIAMLAGIFCVALPTGILCTEFSQLYHERSTASKHAHLSKQLTRRPKHELELYLNSKTLSQLRNEVDEAMTYVKHLSVCYIDITGTKAELDPLWGTFQTQTTEAINALRMYVQMITDEIVLRVQRDEAIPGFEVRTSRDSDGPTPRTGEI
jgi:voltage-gated potassium channel Kch